MLKESVLREFPHYDPQTDIVQFWKALTNKYTERPFLREDVEIFRLSGVWRMSVIQPKRTKALEKVITTEQYEVIVPQGKELTAVYLNTDDMNLIKNEVIKVLQRRVVDQALQQAMAEGIKHSLSCGIIFKDVPEVETIPEPVTTTDAAKPKPKKKRKSKVEQLVLKEKERFVQNFEERATKRRQK